MATRMFDRRVEFDDPSDRAGGMLARHGEVLGRVARQYSLCADDAQDAVQRALEIYMRRLSSLDPATDLAWLKVVVKHEALAVRRARAGVGGEEVDLDAVPAAAERTVEERFESSERVARSAEVMRRLKRDEARALMLKAEGLSYVEIGERLGWTYTKVNRCITEGRRRFMKLYRALETGEECERLAPIVAALVEGTVSSEALLELRPHLRNCAACRATARTLHASRLGRLGAWLPLGGVVAPLRGVVERWRGGGDGGGRVADGASDLHPMERERELDEVFRRIHDGDALSPVSGSAASGVEHASSARVTVRGWFDAAVQRLQSSDVAMGLHAATSGGGGRVASLAALIGVCLSGVGAGTYCVATALLPDPHPGVRAEARAGAKAKHAPPRSARSLVRLPAPASQAVAPTPTPRATPTHAAPRKHPATSAPKSHEQAPASPAPSGTQDFSFEQAADPAPVTPAAVPSTGGGEFEP